MSQYVIVGLGNPGSQYSFTRHNIGALVLDHMHSSLLCERWSSRFKGFVCNTTIDGCKATLIKPQTFMNRSGISVSAAISFNRIPIQNVLVIHDELDLPLGRISFKKGGSNNGHNGLSSISELCGNDYFRLRVGIGRPQFKSAVKSYVLSDFDQHDTPLVREVIRAIWEQFNTFFPMDQCSKTTFSVSLTDQH